MNVYLAADRLSPLFSFLVVDLLLGVGLLTGAVLALASAYRELSRARRLRAEVWRRHGLRIGPIMLTGTAHKVRETIADASGARIDGDERTFIELTITQRGSERPGTRSVDAHVRWEEVARQIFERPFGLRTDDGDEVIVMPDSHIDLIDRLEPAQPVDFNTRTRTARIVDGDKIWLRGVLSGGPGDEDAGPYRGGDSQWVVRPPKDGPLFVSSEPVQAEGLRSALLRAGGAVLLLGLMIFCRCVLYESFVALRAHGVVVQAQIHDRERWRDREHDTQHFAWRFAYPTARGLLTAESETNKDSYATHTVGDMVPVTFLPSHPEVVQLGPLAEVGASTDPLWLLLSVLGFLVIMIGHRPWWLLRFLRPWWKSENVVDRVPGKLGG